MSKEINRKEIKKNLQKGDIKEVADNLQFSPDYVSLVLKGERTNMEVLEALIAKSEENKSKRELLITRSNNL